MDGKTAVVIGAGVAGCCASALLAANGVKVILVEKKPYVGGRAATRSPGEWGWTDEPWSEYGVDFGHHVFGANGFLERVVDETGARAKIDLHKLPMAYFLRNGQLNQAPATFWESLGAYNYVGIREKLKLFRFNKFAQKIPTREAMEKYGRVPLRQLVERFRLGPQAAEIIVEGFAAGYQTTVDLDKNSAGDLILCMKLLQRGFEKYRTTAVLYPSGGFGRVSEALAGVVKDRGGEVLTGHRVDRIATEPGPSGGGFRATGVVVEGNEIKADSVICTIPVFHLPPLFDDGVIAAHKDFFDRAEEGSNASSRLALLICGGRQVLFDKPRNTWVFVPRSQLEEFGEYFLISELDSSQGVAPPGKQILTCATLVEGKAPDLREFRVKMERELKRLFPKLDLAQADWITAQYFPVVDGIARTIDWYGETRIGPATPVKNFFVAGDTTREYSTGTDGCANSAYLAAGQVLGRTLVRIEDVF